MAKLRKNAAAFPGLCVQKAEMSGACTDDALHVLTGKLHEVYLYCLTCCIQPAKYQGESKDARQQYVNHCGNRRTFFTSLQFNLGECNYTQNAIVTFIEHSLSSEK